MRSLSGWVGRSLLRGPAVGGSALLGLTSTEQRGVPEGPALTCRTPGQPVGASRALHSGSQEGSSKASPQHPLPPAPLFI